MIIHCIALKHAEKWTPKDKILGINYGQRMSQDKRCLCTFVNLSVPPQLTENKRGAMMHEEIKQLTQSKLAENDHP